MDYWSGVMNWPLAHPWKCPVCDSNTELTFHGLTWGITHGVCRCNQCHTQFSMRDGEGDDRQRTNTPVWLAADKYRETLPAVWQKLRTPMADWTEADLEALP